MRCIPFSDKRLRIMWEPIETDYNSKILNRFDFEPFFFFIHFFDQFFFIHHRKITMGIIHYNVDIFLDSS